MFYGYTGEFWGCVFLLIFGMKLTEILLNPSVSLNGGFPCRQLRSMQAGRYFFEVMIAEAAQTLCDMAVLSYNIYI